MVAHKGGVYRREIEMKNREIKQLEQSLNKCLNVHEKMKEWFAREIIISALREKFTKEIEIQHAAKMKICLLYRLEKHPYGDLAHSR